jgi:predicted aminopeptidase
MQASRPIEDWLTDASTPAELRERLRLAQDLRAFASRELALPDNASYRRYADLGRSAVVWNVVAAPVLSLELKTWCFPVTGCVGYRGHFEEARAQNEARQLREQGWEVHVYGVPAYSTLGWTNWMGGDPVLNTFARGSPIELARLMFHELAHQVVYVSGDMAFSEGYATAVEQLGLAHWERQAASSSVSPTAWTAWQRRQAQRQDLMLLIQAHKAELAALYRSRMADGARLERKRDLQARLEQRYVQLRDGAWQGDRAFDPWVKSLNNASLALQGSYQDLVPAFTALFEREGRDFARWHAAVKVLAARPAEERRAALRELCATCMNDGVQPRPSP